MKKVRDKNPVMIKAGKKAWITRRKNAISTNKIAAVQPVIDKLNNKWGIVKSREELESLEMVGVDDKRISVGAYIRALEKELERKVPIELSLYVIHKGLTLDMLKKECIVQDNFLKRKPK